MSPHPLFLARASSALQVLPPAGLDLLAAEFLGNFHSQRSPLVSASCHAYMYLYIEFSSESAIRPSSPSGRPHNRALPDFQISRSPDIQWRKRQRFVRRLGLSPSLPVPLKVLLIPPIDQKRKTGHGHTESEPDVAAAASGGGGGGGGGNASPTGIGTGHNNDDAHAGDDGPDTSKPTAVFTPKGGRAYTVSVALPGSIIAKCVSPHPSPSPSRFTLCGRSVWIDG